MTTKQQQSEMQQAWAKYGDGWVDENGLADVVTVSVSVNDGELHPIDEQPEKIQSRWAREFRQVIERDQVRLQALEAARRALGIETLETRNSDRLDFHDLAVWNVRAALEAAYEAGRKAGAKATR